MSGLQRAEINVIGAVFSEPHLIHEVVEKTDLENFTSPHDIILKAIHKIGSGQSKRFKNVSALTVWELLKGKRPAVEREYLGKIIARVTSRADFEDSLNIVADASIKKRLGNSLDKISTAINGDQDIEDIIADIDDTRRDVSEWVDRAKKLHDIGEHLDDVKRDIRKILTNPNRMVGIPSGFPRIDFFTGGIQNDFVIIGGRPSMGKTALALDFCDNSIMYYGKKPGMFSYEMRINELLLRMVCASSQISFMKIKRGQMTKGDEDRLADTIDQYKKLDFYIDDGIHDLDVLASKIETARDVHGIDYAIVDYVQLIPVPAKFGCRSREEEVAKISSTLKALVKKLNIPIIAVAQLSRLAARKKGMPPTLDDLRESGALEQDADLVLFVHRPFYYGVKERKGKNMVNVAEIIIAKQRNGPTGVAEIIWDDHFGHFSNPTMKWVNIVAQDH